MNQHSIIHNFDERVLHRPNFELIEKALQYKQEKLDTNRAKLQNVYDQYSALQVHNDVDQQYIENRLERVKDITNKYANMDLSDDNFASSLMGTVSQVLDDKVKNAVLSTRVIQAEDAEWKKMKTDKPELYSDGNRAYALEHSDRGNYENAQVAGTMYKGGAGFIEYRDLSKKVMDNLPKLRDTFKMEYQQTGPNEGYFRYMDTYKTVDKDALSGAVELLFDEKDKQQIGINAWATYDKQPDELIKKDWENFQEPEKELASNNISALRTALADPKNADMADEYREQLNSWEKKKSDLDNYTYEKVVATSGREGVYSALYSEKYKKGIVDTYSGATTIERKIDETHKANVEFQQKLIEAQRADDRWSMDYGLRLAKDKREEEKARGISAANGTGGAGGADFTKVDSKAIGYGEQKSDVDKFQEEESKSINDAKTVLRKEFGFSLTNKEFQDVTNQLNPGKVDANEKVEVMIRGEKQIIDMSKHYDTFLNLHNNVRNESPEKTNYYKNIKSGVWATAYDIGVLASSGNGNVTRHLPNYSVKIIENKKGEFEMVKTTQEGAHYYNWLAKKQGLHNKNSDKYPPLSKAEQKTMELYTGMTLVLDDEFEDTNKKGVYRYVADKALKGVKTNGLLPSYSQLTEKRIPEVGINNMQTGSGSDPVSLKIKKYQSIAKGRPLTPTEKAEYYKLAAGTRSFIKGGKPTDSLSDMGYYDTNFTDRLGGNSDMGDMETRLDKRFKNIRESFETELSNVNLEKTVYKMSTAPGTVSHAKLTRLLGAQLGLEKDNKKQINIERVIKADGTIDESRAKVSYVIPATSTKAAREEVAFIDSKILAENGMPFESIERTPYRAELGSSAAKIEMGNNYVDNNKRSLYRKNNGGALPTDVIDQDVYTDLEKRGKTKQSSELKSKVSMYKSGKYLFNIEPIGGSYYRTISLRNSDGELENVYVGDEVGSKIQTGEVKTLMTDKFLKNETTFLQYAQEGIDND